MRVEISHLNDEGLDTIVSLEGDTPGEKHGMGRLYAKVTGPELCSLNRWGMNHELISVDIQSSSGLEASDVGAMTELSLSVAADDVPVVYLGHVVSHLLFTAKLQDRLGEHLHVEGHGVGAGEQVEPVEVLALFVRVVRDQVPVLVVSHDDLEAVPPLFELVFS